MNNHPQKVIWILSALLLCFPFAGLAVQTSLVNTQTINIENTTAITINYLSDNVTIYEGAENKLVLKEYMSRSDESYLAQIMKSGRSLTIRCGERPRAQRFASNIEIYLPPEFTGSLSVSTVSGKIELKNSAAETISIKTISGSIQAADINSDLNVQSNSGSISIRNITGNSTLKSISSRIEIESIRGNSKIMSNSGALILGSLTGDRQELSTSSGAIKAGSIQAELINVKSISGKISLNYVQGRLSASTSSGKIIVTKGVGTANISSVSGAISAEYGSVTDNLFLKTSSGKVSLTVPDEPSFYLDAASSSGAIRTNYNNEKSRSSKSVSRQVGSKPAYSIKINTISGSIDITARPSFNKEVLNLPHIL